MWSMACRLGFMAWTARLVRVSLLRATRLAEGIGHGGILGDGGVALCQHFPQHEESKWAYPAIAQGKA